MNVLVTGSSGHLGEALVRTLRDRGDNVLGIDITASPFTTTVGSVTDTEMVRQVMDGIDVVYHTATLHKPHIVTHSKHAFVDTNVSGTLVLLEAAVESSVKAFVFTSTTSVYGDAMSPSPGGPAVWVTEELHPIPNNIYGVTKMAAENLCRIVHLQDGLDCIILRTSRFFPELDDDPAMRSQFFDKNIKANEFLYRRADVEDVVSAHLLAAKHAPSIGFGRYIISATTPFVPEDLDELAQNPAKVVEARIPGFAQCFERLNWRMFDRIGRVYVNAAARKDLGWKPRFDFGHVLKCLSTTNDFTSRLAKLIGAKGYHEQSFADGPYPVE